MGAMASPHLSLIRENRRSEAPLCGTVKIAGTKRDRPFSSGKKYLEVKAGSGKPGKTCIPLWTRSIDAREQGQVFWLVSPRAVSRPRKETVTVRIARRMERDLQLRVQLRIPSTALHRIPY